MHRRRVLHGLVAGVPLFAGCSMLADDGGNASAGDNTTEGNGTTAAATDVAETIRETATQTATATPTATATATPTATPTRTATPTPTATSTVTATATQTSTEERTTGRATTAVGTAGEAPVIDPSGLTTYTSEVYPYSVKRPADWTVDASDPELVTFEPETGSAFQQVTVNDSVGSASLDAFVSRFNTYASELFSEYRTLNRRSVTLPNGNSGVVLGVTITDSSLGGVALRGKLLFAIGGEAGYVVQVLVSDDAYTSTVEAAMTTIVESLTIRDA